MGTDIYMYSERRGESAWLLCSPLTPDPGVSLPEPLPAGFLAPASIYDRRNYDLFAILAGVRNCAHSAVPYQPIAAARGLPADLSDALAVWVARWGAVDDASWLLLRELEEFPWHDRRITKDAPSGGSTTSAVETYAQSAGDEFLVETMARLRQCGPSQGVRIVFWFSS
jgi:hypothetical protein